MFRSKVYYLREQTHRDRGRERLERFGRVMTELLREIGIAAKDYVAIKTHFGESTKEVPIRPEMIREVVSATCACGAIPFLAETTTLYSGLRSTAVAHLYHALAKGFTWDRVGAPLIIADGLRGRNCTDVPVDGEYVKVAYVASDIAVCEGLIGVAHFTGHEICGFGGALKNIAMGCASRAGKISMHADGTPRVDESKCTGCRSCIKWCPVQAISLRNGTGYVDHAVCIGCGQCLDLCAHDAIILHWNERSHKLQRKLAEYAYAATRGKNDKCLYVNVLEDIAGTCDCHESTEPAIVDDIGILISRDIVAIDQASVDLVNSQRGKADSRMKGGLKPGEDKFKALYPWVDWSTQLEHAERMQLGNREYELILCEETSNALGVTLRHS